MSTASIPIHGKANPMNTASDFERGDRVWVTNLLDGDETGTVTGWYKPPFGDWHVDVELDNGEGWTGDPEWLEHAPHEPDDGILADRHYERELDRELGI